MNKIQIASVFFVAFIVLGPFAIGYMGQLEREAKIERKAEELAALSNDKDYKILCPDYRDVNIIWKLTTYRDLAWCEDYLDKL